MIVRLVTHTGGVSRAADASARAVGLGCGLGKIEVIILCSVRAHLLRPLSFYIVTIDKPPSLMHIVSLSSPPHLLPSLTPPPALASPARLPAFLAPRRHDHEPAAHNRATPRSMLAQRRGLRYCQAPHTHSLTAHAVWYAGSDSGGSVRGTVPPSMRARVSIPGYRQRLLAREVPGAVENVPVGRMRWICGYLAVSPDASQPPDSQ